MSSAALAIRTRGLRKAYRLYTRPIDALLEAVTGRQRHVERVALDNIDLELQRGEIVGVLGRNGAGKSTLLKIIAGTLERTAGELEVKGRITAILELGTGFHPEYTGRENIYMGGMCLGMSKAEIDSKLESIIEFSELRDVIDQPFKTYSTGMQARLTFSTAISVEPEILIVDEALSVGDAKFQMKCFSWLQTLRERNCTVLLVSHDTNTITSFCDRAIILEKGRIYAQGAAKKVASEYLRVLFGNGEATSMAPGNPAPGHSYPIAPQDTSPHESEASRSAESARYGDGDATVLDFDLLDESGSSVRVLESGSRCRLEMRLRFNRPVEALSTGFAVKDRKGTVVHGVTNVSQNLPLQSGSLGETLVVTTDMVMWLSSGDYFINLGIGHLRDGSMMDFIDDAIHFKVYGPGGIFTTSVVNLQSQFAMRFVRDGVPSDA